MAIEGLISTILGNGLVIALSGFFFSRLIGRVDELSTTIVNMQVMLGKLIDKTERIDKIEDHISDGDNRLTRLETIANSGKH